MKKLFIACLGSKSFLAIWTEKINENKERLNIKGFSRKNLFLFPDFKATHSVFVQN